MKPETVLESKAAFYTKEKISGHKGYKNTVKYLDNVARIGNSSKGQILDNRSGEVFRESMVTPRPHFYERAKLRGISPEEACFTISKGIEVRSDRGRNETYIYLYNDILVAAKKLPQAGHFEAITAYRISRAYKENFITHSNLASLESEILATGASRFRASISDLTMLASQLVFRSQGEGSLGFSNPTCWALNEPAISSRNTSFEPSPDRIYALHITITNPKKICLNQLNILHLWGLGTADALESFWENGSIHHRMTYKMTRFSPNSHEWNNKK